MLKTTDKRGERGSPAATGGGGRPATATDGATGRWVALAMVGWRCGVRLSLSLYLELRRVSEPEPRAGSLRLGGDGPVTDILSPAQKNLNFKFLLGLATEFPSPI